MTNKTLVFAGPTLSGLGAWKASHASRHVFHAPVQCGHMLEAYREGYRTIVIVDGLFERCPAVWHKEIMYVIENGGVVVGCSSMGALRAVELSVYGMLGFGKVVEDFKAGRIADDDEVTVGHLGAAQDYKCLTDAMVNIRCTVADALARGVIDDAAAQSLLRVAKAMFYKNRSLALAAREALAGDALARFGAYLEQHGVIDQKRADAIALLDDLDGYLKRTPQPGMPEPVADTVHLQNLWHLGDVNPPGLQKQALSRESRILKQGHLLVGRQYHLLSQLAGAMAHYSKAILGRAVPPYEPVSWLDTRWFEGDEALLRLLSAALADCPQYRDTREVPRGVRYLAFQHEFPLSYLDLELPETDVLSTNSVKTYTRLFHLLGLFLDARLCHDPLAQRVAAPEKAIELRMALCTLRGYQTEDEQRGFLATWGLDNLRDAASHVERNVMLLSEVTTGVSFRFLERGTYWYRLAISATGLWPQLCSLERPEVRAAFAQELADDLRGLPEPKRISELLQAYLPWDLVTPESILKYLASEVDA